eukprot:TRINITY_DN1221_c0_g1_i2.p1 TRINITY_DN1221_c0_g1~~TRINITY_DN1221_c0_g1_i2.p1  ORF type:complete len:117 (-),score=28.37 TRINITY_DN1221_c0_g1_i2:139-459(-)
MGDHFGRQEFSGRKMVRKSLLSHVFKLVDSGKKLPTNQFAFHVPQSLTKPEIAHYLENLYQVRVKKVNTMNYRGKVKRSAFGLYKRPDYKKAYVTLFQPPKERPSA